MKIQECERSFIVKNCFHIEHAITAVLIDHYPDKEFDQVNFDGVFYFFKNFWFCLKAVKASDDVYVIVEVNLKKLTDKEE